MPIIQTISTEAVRFGDLVWIDGDQAGSTPLGQGTLSQPNVPFDGKNFSQKPEHKIHTHLDES